MATGGAETGTQGDDSTSSPGTSVTEAGVTSVAPTTTSDTPTAGNTATSDPDTGDSDPSAGESASFISQPDGGLAGQCDPKLQDCPKGEKCSAVSIAIGEPWGGNTCVPRTGDGQVGDPCDIEDNKYSGLDNCDLGLICLLTDEDGKGGACTEFCSSQDQCPNTPGAKCVVYNDGSLPICLNNCDPLVQDCPEGQACYNSAGDDFVCFKQSAMPGQGAPGDECAYINQCQKGSFCANATSLAGCATPSCCTPYCPVSGGNQPCNPGEDCVAFFEQGSAPPGLEDIGVCSLPG